MVENHIKIQQTIHGYKEGHTLLSSSLDLSIGERKELQLLSDYSGTGVEVNFSDYITGYPLSNSKYYAIAKTWYANEMPRPGSVWTHTLLIEISVLWTIKNIDLLLSAFKRPEKDNINKNLEALQFPLEDLNARNYTLTQNQYLISCSLYSSNKPLIILSRAEADFQRDILNIWTYQWPRLKRNFSFCTGSIGLRSIGKESFDLQIIPQNRDRMISRPEKEKYSFFESKGQGCDSNFLREYESEDPELVLDFMTKFGSDLLPEKRNFSLLLTFFNAAKDIAKRNYHELIDLLINDLPSSNEGKLLKSNIVQLLFNVLRKYNYELILSLLTEKALSELKWDFALLIHNSWSEKSITANQTLKVLEYLKINDENRQDLIMLLSALPLDLWIGNPSLYQQWLEDILVLNNELLYKDVIWKSEDKIQNIWWRILSKTKNPKWSRIINNMLSVQSSRYAAEIFAIVGDEVFEMIFSWLHKSNATLPIDWEYLIRQKPASAFRSLSLVKNYNSNQISVIPKVLSPTEGTWFEVVQSDFESFFNKLINFEDVHTQTSIYTFFITTAFSNTAIHPEQISEMIFQPLHDNLKKSIYDFNTWNRFKMLMGRDLYDMIELDFFSKLFKERNEVPEWDHCEFLRRSLMSCFLKYKWDPYYIILIVKDELTFKKIVEFGVDVKPVKKILKQAKQRLEENRQENSFYYKILSGNI